MPCPVGIGGGTHALPVIFGERLYRDATGSVSSEGSAERIALVEGHLGGLVLPNNAATLQARASDVATRAKHGGNRPATEAIADNNRPIGAKSKGGSGGPGGFIHLCSASVDLINASATMKKSVELIDASAIMKKSVGLIDVSAFRCGSPPP